MNNNETKKSKSGKKISHLYVIIPSAFIAALILASFFVPEDRVQITTPIIVLVSLMVAVALSKFFKTITVGKYLTLSKVTKEYKERTKSLENMTVKLAQQVTQSVNNSQQINNVNAPVINFSVGRANDIEINDFRPELQAGSQRNKQRDNTEMRVLETFFKGRPGTMLRNVKITNFNAIDPIGGKLAVFDAYLYEDKEQFVEITQDTSHFFYYRLYTQLNTIHHYRTVKNPNAIMLLLVVNDPAEKKTDRTENLKEYFSNAITSGMLKIHHVDLP